MRYKDYKIEDCVFMNKELWTEEEKREVLDTFPETKGTEEKIAALEQLKIDVANGVLKTNRWGELNMRSSEAYAKRHPSFIYKRETYRCAAGFYINFDNNDYYIRTSYQIDKYINMLNCYESRFERMCAIYKNKENKYVKDNADNLYKETNKNRIDLSRQADCWLDAIRLQVATNISRTTYRDGYDNYNFRKEFSGFNWRNHNRYEEITMHGELLSEEDLQKVIELSKDLSERVSILIDKYNAEFELIRLKYKDIAKLKENGGK